MSDNSHKVTGCNDCPFKSLIDWDWRCRLVQNIIITPAIDTAMGSRSEDYHPDCPLKKGPITIELTE